jgi:membrane protein
MYWAVLTLMPILAGTGIAMTVYISSLPYFKGAAESINDTFFLLNVLPFMFTWAAFTTLYVALPNTRVYFRDAVLGAFVAAILFEVAKSGFAYYVSTFSTYQFIYGAVAAVPIFLVWIYVSWLIVLFGAVVSYIKQRHREKSQRMEPSESDS